MTESQKQAYEWAKRMNYQSVAAKYAKTLALLVDELLAAHAKLEPNNPMTLDELREMDGEPVWIKSLTDQTERWGLVSLFRQATTGKLYVYIYDTGHGERNLSSQEYGMTWLAYRCKPEEEHHVWM